VARTAHDTRDKLITIGQHLFAEQGVFRVPLRTVIERAGQKNTSALHYHFGGREGLLNAIIERHNDGIEEERAAMLEQIAADQLCGDIPVVVRAFVLPFARKLETDEGREFLRVIAQLTDLFDFWDEGPPRTPAQAHAAMAMIAAAIPDQPGEVRHERVTTMLMLVSDALALRARQIDQGRVLHLTNEAFVANLIDMSVGALQAPSLSM
jgi:AcrR family transcriptional regulator